MGQAFEVVDLGAAEQELSIEVRPGHTWEGMDCEPGTDFVISPPLTEEEHTTLIEKHGPGSQIGELLLFSREHIDHSLTLNVEDEPSEEQIENGIELAKEIITLKGLKAGKVVSAIGETTHEYLVLSQKGSIKLRPQLVDPEDIAEFVAVDREQVYRWIAEDRIPFVDLQDGEYKIPLHGFQGAMSQLFDMEGDMEKLLGDEPS
jgi:hypothetical protein